MMVTGWVVALSLVLQVPAGPVSTEDLGEAYYLFLQGRVAEARGDLAGAIGAYQAVIAKVPGAADVRADLAVLYARLGQADQSIAEAEAALAADPANREAHRILGFVQSALADRQGAADGGSLARDAIEHLEQALADGTRDPAAELTLGRLYVREGDYDEAVETLTGFLVDQPGYPEGVRLLADARVGQGNLPAAIAILEKLVADAPDQTDARERLGTLYEQSGQWLEAADVWRALLATSGERTYRTRYATALVNGGDVETGRRELLDITRETPTDVSAWYLLSQVERRAGNADGAERAAREIMTVAPDDARGLLALAESSAARGDFAGVVKTLESRVAAPEPNDVAAGVFSRMAVDLALAFDELGDTARAVTVLEAAGDRVSGDEDLAFELAAAYERDGRSADAEQAFRAIIARNPTNAGALNYLGYMLADRGEHLEEAAALVGRALAVEPDNPSYLDSLGWAYFRLGRLDDALDPLRRAADALPRTSVIHDHLGDVYFGLKRYRDAAATWDQALAGDREGIDVKAVTAKRDRARDLAGRE